MLNAIEGEDGGSALFEAEEVWPEETTAVIPAEQLEWLRDVMDADDRPTARFQPVRDDLMAAGSSAELPLSEMCDPVVTFRRASGRIAITPVSYSPHPSYDGTDHRMRKGDPPSCVRHNGRLRRSRRWLPP